MIEYKSKFQRMNKLPSKTKKSTKAQRRFLKELLKRTGYTDGRGKLKDFAWSLPYGIEGQTSSAKWIKSLTICEASDLIRCLL